MANYSKLLSLISGADRTVDFSLPANVLELSNIQMDGSTSGHVVISASAVTTTYAMIWPATQAASAGYVLTNDGTGQLSWSAAASSGANTTLSNLTSPTAINQDLIPSGTRVLGASGSPWSALWVNEILAPGQIDFQLTTGHLFNNSGSFVADFTNNILADNTQNNSIDWQNRELIDSSGTAAQLSWSTSGVIFNQLTASTVPYLNASKVLTSSAVTPTQLGFLDATSSIQTQLNGKLSLSGGTMTSAINMGTNQINNAADPTSAQDVATKNYVDTTTISSGLMTTEGDIIYENATPAPARLPIGSTGQILTVVSGVPAWATPAAGGTVTSVSVASANGFAGTVATSTTTPAITIETTLSTPVLAGNGTALIAATTTGTGSIVALSASPTFTGTLNAAAASFTSAINLNSNQINGVATPTSSTDAATKGYVDAAISGLTWKGPAQAYSANNVALTGGATLTIDGYTLQNNDLVILGNQTTASENGEYAVSGIGTAYVLTANGLPNTVGDAWLITNGTIYKNSAFVATAVVPAATFTEFAGPTAYVFSSPLSLSGNTVSIGQSSTSTDGYLSSTDWNTFNDKQAAGSYLTALTGDGTAAGPGSSAFTLATVNANVGSFGSSTSIPTFTVNGKGLITAASGNAVVAPAGTLSGTALNSTVVTSSLTSVGTITTGVWNGTAIAIANGGTGQTTANSAFNALSPMTTAGDLIFENATPVAARLGIGTTGQVLTVVAGLPAWSSPATSGTVTSVALADGSTTPIFAISGSPVTVSGTLTQTLTTQSANTIFAGPTTGSAQPSFRSIVSADLSAGIIGTTQLAAASVTAAKLGTVTDGVTLDQSGSGSTIEIKAGGVGATQLGTGAFDQVTITGGGGTAASVAQAPSLKRTLIAGQTFTANTSYAVRWGITANGETAGRVYAADIATSSFDLFYVIGMAVSAAGVTAGGNISVTTLGSFALSSADTAFATGTDGGPVFLTATGTFSVTAPSSSGQAITRIGILQTRSATVTSNIIDVYPAFVAVN